MPRYKIEDLRAFAENKGGECLSNEYKTNDNKYLWRCSKNHQFEMLWMTIKVRGAWCGKCKWGGCIEKLHKHAEKQDGKCLSKTFNQKKNFFVCFKSHTFNLSWQSVQRGAWCRYCSSGYKQTTIKDLQKLAKERDGMCLSDKYISAHTKYLWKCVNGHTWNATFNNVFRGETWCPECGLWTLEKLDEIAKINGGRCLKLVNGAFLEGRYLWQCEHGHTWNAKGGNVVYNATWCAESLKLTL